MQKIIAIAAVSVVTATTQPEIDTVVLSTALPGELVASPEAVEVHADKSYVVGVVPDEATRDRIELPREMITEIQKFIPIKHRSSLYRFAIRYLPRINGEGIGAYAGVSEHASLQYIRIVKAVKEMEGFQTLEETLEYIWTQEGILRLIRDSPVLSSLSLHQIQGGTIDPNQAATLLDILRGHLEFLAGSWPIRSDAAFAALIAAHPRGDLRVLRSSGLQVTDAGLVHLSNLTNLRELYLSYTQITGAGLAHLANFTNLRGLSLYRTQITDAGLVHLSNLTNLQVLYLSDTQITGAGLVHLSNLTNLQVLSLSRTQITDAGLSHLANLTNLRWLYLPDTQITPGAKATLKARIPGLAIYG